MSGSFRVCHLQHCPLSSGEHGTPPPNVKLATPPTATTMSWTHVFMGVHGFASKSGSSPIPVVLGSSSKQALVGGYRGTLKRQQRQQTTQAFLHMCILRWDAVAKEGLTLHHCRLYLLGPGHLSRHPGGQRHLYSGQTAGHKTVFRFGKDGGFLKGYSSPARKNYIHRLYRISLNIK